ncbi:MAG TPA: FAD-binding protein [Desulfotomaculum sp.]|nr:MAG: thioredoxin-disulfide reductase [Desulfotomaculum sp. BICA1-6]HBX23126.1 FAD-binding protein [Desulfotomaculum sp.]
MYDTVIIGMGPAGMTAAVYAARKKMNTMLVGKEYGGQVAWTSEVENYMGFQMISGPGLMDKFEEQVKHYPVERKQSEVIRVEKEGDHFVVRCKDGEEYHCRTVIYSAGKYPRRLNVPGEKKFTGQGVSYCAVCDGPFFEGKPVAVIGGGNSALEAVIDMLKIAVHVYVVSIEDWNADPVLAERALQAQNITVLKGYQTLSINGEENVRSITIRSLESGEEKELAVEGVFVEIGTMPSNEPVKGLVQINKLGEIEVDCSCNTNVPGLFAAGDVTSIPEKQVIVAAGEGAKAALGAYRHLLTSTPVQH